MIDCIIVQTKDHSGNIINFRCLNPNDYNLTIAANVHVQFTTIAIFKVKKIQPWDYRSTN
jgi:hypothetical protein